MNYELAQQLKEAGFPQKPILGSGYWRDGLLSYVGYGDYFPGPDYPLKRPNLSELIEACGEITIKLWINGKEKEHAVQLEGQGLDDRIWYRTPEEAVANLWLELNRK